MSHDVTLWFGPDHKMDKETYEEIVYKFVNKLKKVYNIEYNREDSLTIDDSVWRNQDRSNGIFYQASKNKIDCWIPYKSAQEIKDAYPEEIFWSINDVEEDLLTFYQVRNLP